MIEGPSNFTDEKPHPLVWSTCQCPMQDTTVVIVPILHTKHYVINHRILPYSNPGRVDIIVPILQIKKKESWRG